MRAAALFLALGSTAAAAQPAAEQLRFITCPVYRDTDAGKKSGCWLADRAADGLRYDVTRSPTKPDWNYAILVEGIERSDVSGNCGGIVLDPVRVSVLSDQKCVRHMLPAEGYAGDDFVLPERNVRPVSEVRPAPPRPFTDKSFAIPFDFDSPFIVYQLSDYLFDEAVTYIRGVNPRQVVVTGWAATDPAYVSGQRIAEDAALARERAEMIAESLRRMGVPGENIETRWRTGAQPAPIDGADGLVEPSRRRVDIDVRL